MHKTRIDIPESNRKKLCALLNERLADSLALALNTKQAHWNVKGPNFIALHELFDRIAAALHLHSDEIAERITTLGGTAFGTPASIQKSSLANYKEDIFSGEQHLGALADQLSTFAKSTRQASLQAGEIGDEDTADLFTGVSRDIDKNLWFIEAHLQERT